MENQLVFSVAKEGSSKVTLFLHFFSVLLRMYSIEKDKQMVNSGLLKPMSSPKGFATPSHTLYADDILFFCKGTKKNIEVLMDLFHSYN